MRSPIEAMRNFYSTIMNCFSDDSQGTIGIIEVTGEALDSLDEVVNKLGAPSELEIIRRALTVYHGIADRYSPSNGVVVQIGNQLLDVTHLFSDFEPEYQGPNPKQPQNPKPRRPTGKIVDLTEYRKLR